MAPPSTTPSPTIHHARNNLGVSGSGMSSAAPYITVDAADGSSSEPNNNHNNHNDNQYSLSDGGGVDPDSSEHKKARACEACRGLKVRCEPDPHNDDAPCKRCYKAGRNCVVTQPTRKRQKKSDSRVAELEKKIDLLTASIHARAQPGSSAASASGLGNHGHGGDAVAENNAGSGRGSTSATPANTARTHARLPAVRTSHSVSPTTNNPALPGANSSPAEQRRYPLSAVEELGAYGSTWGTEPQPKQWGLSAPLPSKASFSPNPSLGSREANSPVFQPPMVTAGQKRKSSALGDSSGEDHERGIRSPPARSPAVASLLTKSAEGDVVDRGIMTMEVAAECFRRYNVDLVRHMPAVLFPASMTVADLRKKKPVLFLSVMAVGAYERSDLQRSLQREVALVLAEKIMLNGEKSLELVQAILLNVVWYWAPDNFEELKFYQLVHMAAVMGLDIGLGKKPVGRRRRAAAPFSWRDNPFRRQAPLDPTSLECRRTWLACYFLCSNSAVALRRPHLLRWTPFMTECVEVLQTSSEAELSDPYLCHLVWTHRMAEEVGSYFITEDSEYCNTSISDLRTQHSIKAMQRDVKEYLAGIPEEQMQPTFKIGLHFLQLYVHELALRSQTATDQWRPPFNTDNLTEGLMNPGPISSAHLNAISACLQAIHGIFDTFLALPVETVRCLPVYNFVRVAYALVVLLKMYFSVSSPKLDLANVIEKGDMRVEHYINALVDHFRLAAINEMCRSASKFGVVLAMLRSWFFKQIQADPATSSASYKDDPAAAATRFQQHQPSSSVSSSSNNHFHNRHATDSPQVSDAQRQQLQASNTPLHLLSEIATSGNPSLPPPPLPTSSAAQSFLRQPTATHSFFPDNTPSTSSAPTPTGLHDMRSTSRPRLPPLGSGYPDTTDSSGQGAFPPPSSTWLAPQSQQQQQQSLPTDLGLGIGDTSFGNLGFGFGANLPQEVNDDTMKLFMSVSDTWLTDVMQGLPDTDLFPF